MLMLTFLWLLLLTTSAIAYAGQTSRRFHLLGPQGVNLQRLEKLQDDTAQSRFTFQVQDGGSNDQVETPAYTAAFEEQWFEQPLDHFNLSSGHNWRQRYWVNKRHYKPGSRGPVVVLDGGETSGEVSNPSYRG